MTTKISNFLDQKRDVVKSTWVSPNLICLDVLKTAGGIADTPETEIGKIVVS